MRALVCTAALRMEMAELPRPRAAEGECAIAVEAAGICGLDVAAFAGRSRYSTLPAVLGHELVGRLDDGRRVVANPFTACGRCARCRSGAPNLCAEWRLLGTNGMQGCFAEQVCVADGQVYEIPEEMAAGRAVLAEPLANVVHLLRLAGMDERARVGIVGAGQMGALALQAGLRAGTREVVVVEPIAARRAAALTMGATVAWEGADEALKAAGEGCDLVIDACGSGAARRLALALCRPGGVVGLLGMAERRSEVDFGAGIRKELRVQMAFGYTPEDFAGSVELLAVSAIELDAWTEESAMEDGQRALETASGERSGVLKRVLRVA